MSGAELLAWYNIGFVAVFMLGLVLLLIGLFGMGGEHDVSHDVSGHDVDDAHANETGHSALLDFLGVGRCPLSIVLMVLCFLFALVGIVTTITLRAVYAPSVIVGLVAYPVAVMGSFLLTGTLARLIGRVMPSNETYVESATSHIGALGKAIYTFENGQGFVQVHDKSGTVHEIKATCADGFVLTAGASVLVLDYNTVNHTFLVQRAPSELTSEGT
jgi:hypothetical protein